MSIDIHKRREIYVKMLEDFTANPLLLADQGFCKWIRNSRYCYNFKFEFSDLPELLVQKPKSTWEQNKHYWWSVRTGNQKMCIRAIQRAIQLCDDKINEETMNIEQLVNEAGFNDNKESLPPNIRTTTTGDFEKSPMWTTGSTIDCNAPLLGGSTGYINFYNFQKIKLSGIPKGYEVSAYIKLTDDYGMGIDITSVSCKRVFSLSVLGKKLFTWKVEMVVKTLGNGWFIAVKRPLLRDVKFKISLTEIKKGKDERC